MVPSSRASGSNRTRKTLILRFPARAVRLLLSNTATAQELFNNCAAHGGKAWDHSALVRALDMMANDDIGAPVPE